MAEFSDFSVQYECDFIEENRAELASMSRSEMDRFRGAPSRCYG
jgi:hypothetical protein